MQIQGAKGVNVSSNALTWLKRLTLTGSDLPELYVKIRGKLLAYNAEGNEALRAVIKEIGILGNKLGDEIKLAQTSCCYFLLLGQSLTVDILPGKEN
jgi:CRISPR-associated protein Csh1